MLNFSKTKILIISFIAVFTILFSLPSFFPKHPVFSNLPLKKISLGLDLQGGSQLLIKVDSDYHLKEQITNIQEELKNELRHKIIKASPVITSKNQIAIKSVDPKDLKEIKNIIKSINSNLEIEESNQNIIIYFSDSQIIKIKNKLIQQSSEILRRRIDENGTKEPIIHAQGDNYILLQVPHYEDEGKNNVISSNQELKNAIGKTAKMTFHFVSEKQNISTNDEKLTDQSGNQIVIEKQVILSGDLLVDAQPTYFEGAPAVSFKFNNIGARKFAQITKDNVGRIFAIVLDNQIITAPRINTVINQGSGVITGSFTALEVNEISLLLRAGALPAPLEIVEEKIVGPSLGLDSIKSGTMAAIAGVVFVAIFMIIFYGKFGLIANIGMIVNVCSIITALALIGATLTLPGIAGIVLTMGIAVDANVLIFERIKEELRNEVNRKLNLLKVFEYGFSNALRTIVDSNITTLIVAFFLYLFGSGAVKGFAVTLSIGIITSMFSSILLTRMLSAIYLKNSSRLKKLTK